MEGPLAEAPSPDAEQEAPVRDIVLGTDMICPRCERQQNILAYRPLEQIEKYARFTTPIFQCPSCAWKFAPSIDLDVLHEALQARVQQIAAGREPQAA